MYLLEQASSASCRAGDAELGDGRTIKQFNSWMRCWWHRPVLPAGRLSRGRGLFDMGGAEIVSAASSATIRLRVRLRGQNEVYLGGESFPARSSAEVRRKFDICPVSEFSAASY